MKLSYEKDRIFTLALAGGDRQGLEVPFGDKLWKQELRNECAS